MTAYAHPSAPRNPWWKRCTTRRSKRTPARCKLARGHEGNCRFGSWSGGGRTYYNLDLPLPEVAERFSAEYLVLLAAAGGTEPEDAKP